MQGNFLDGARNSRSPARTQGGGESEGAEVPTRLSCYWSYDNHGAIPRTNGYANLHTRTHNGMRAHPEIIEGPNLEQIEQIRKHRQRHKIAQS